MKTFKAEILCAEDHHKIFIKTDAENKAHPQVRYECTRKKNHNLKNLTQVNLIRKYSVHIYTT